jgi:hypothetical protein
VRTTFCILVLIGLHAGLARAQAPLGFGSPEAAFAGGPIHLSRTAAGMLRSHYDGDKVPLISQPFRGRLDMALLNGDWTQVETAKKELAAARGIVMVLAWEQSRFIATGSTPIAEMHALDVAATGSTGLSETAVMLWLYAAAVTLTDGGRCVDESLRQAHLDRLRGPAFEPVTRIVRSISDERLAAMRELAMRLESVLAPERTDDTLCRDGTGKIDVKPDAIWRPEAATARTMLSKQLTSLAAAMRPLPIARPEQPRQDTTAAVPKPMAPAQSASGTADPAPFEPEESTSGQQKPEPETVPAETFSFEPEKAEQAHPETTQRSTKTDQ